jgi:hypothetical protein
MRRQEGIHLGSGGHGGLRAWAGDADGRCRRGKPRRGKWVVALEQRYGKGAVEAVAGADGIYGFDLKGAHPGRFAVCDGYVSPFGAALQNYAAQALGQ